MAGIFGFRPNTALADTFLVQPKGNEAYWRAKLANQGSVSKARPSLAGRLENAAVSTLRKAGVSDKTAARLGSKTFAALNDLTPLGNATMAADAGTLLGGGHWLEGLGLGALSAVPGGFGKGMFGRRVRAYHGTGRVFDDFQLGAPETTFGSHNPEAIHLSTSPEIAEAYATSGMRRQNQGADWAPHIRPVDVEFRNPLELSADDFFVGKRAGLPLDQVKGYARTERERYEAAMEAIFGERPRPDETFYSFVRRHGHDGIILKAGPDGGGYGDEIAVFDPSLLKPGFGK